MTGYGKYSPRKRGIILFFGETGRPEFAPIAASCKKRIAEEPTVTMEEVRFLFNNFDLDDELKKNPDRPCLALFFFQSRPGEFPPPLIERIRQIHPMIPIVFLAGPLCEGEERTGSIPPGVIRYYWHEWEPIGRIEFERFLKKKSGRFSLPLTATDDDYYRLRDYSDDLQNDDGSSESPSELLPFVKPEERTSDRSSPDCCVVSPHDGAMEKFLLDGAAPHYERVRSVSMKQLLEESLPDPGRLRRIIVDSVESDAETLFPDVRKMADRFPRAAVDLLLFSPRIEEVLLFTDSIPRLRVHSKPFDLLALFPADHRG